MRVLDVLTVLFCRNYGCEPDEVEMSATLDELNIALRYGWLDIQKVLEDLKNRKEDLNVIVTGRNAPEELLSCSDLVSEIRNIKHPFDSGIP